MRYDVPPGAKSHFAHGFSGKGVPAAVMLLSSLFGYVTC